MKLLTYRWNGLEAVGVLAKDGIHIIPVKSVGLKYESMNALIQGMTAEERKRLQAAVESNAMQGILVSEVEKCAPIPRPDRDIICLGINYMDHAAESARAKIEPFDGNREYAVYFSKRVDEAVADGGLIQGHQDIVDQLDYEVELAVVIGKDAKNVPMKKAFDYVFGYTIMNDVSARNIQTRHKQWYFGKSLDGFVPMGPWIVTEDEFARPPKVRTQSRVNGQVRQDSNTELLIFGVDFVISELSQGMTLQAGTVIAMGTPAGVGMGFDPPKFLRTGDLVECEIEGIGVLKNVVA